MAGSGSGFTRSPPGGAGAGRRGRPSRRGSSPTAARRHSPTVLPVPERRRADALRLYPVGRTTSVSAVWPGPGSAVVGCLAVEGTEERLAHHVRPFGVVLLQAR